MLSPCQFCLSVMRCDIQTSKIDRETIRTQIVAICEEAVQQMQARRTEFEKWFKEKLHIRKKEFSACFESLDTALNNDNPGKAVFALADFATLLGKKLKFETFEEFDDFMTYSDEPLVL